MRIKTIYAALLLLFLAIDSQSADMNMTSNDTLQVQLEKIDKKKNTVSILKGKSMGVKDLTKTTLVKKNSLLFVDDFEEEVVPGKYWDNSGNKSIERRKGLAINNKHSLCFKLDHKKSVVPERTELRLRKKVVEFFLGAEYWIGYSIYIPRNWKYDSSAESLFQWHGFPDKELGEGWRNPVLTFKTQGEHWYIESRWDQKKLTPHMGSAGYLYSGRKQYKVGNIVPGSWTKWVLHIKWSYLEDGILEIWKNGKKVVEQYGGNAFNDSNGPYLKFGIYKWDWKKNSKKRNTDSITREVCFNSIRIAGEGGSYEMVSP